MSLSGIVENTIIRAWLRGALGRMFDYNQVVNDRSHIGRTVIPKSNQLKLRQWNKKGSVNRYHTKRAGGLNKKAKNQQASKALKRLHNTKRPVYFDRLAYDLKRYSWNMQNGRGANTKHTPWLPVDDANKMNPDKTITSMSSSMPSPMEYDRGWSTRSLLATDPIQEQVKALYLKKLHYLKSNPPVIHRREKTFSTELQKSLRSDEWLRNMSPYMDYLENKVKAYFANPALELREGNLKTSFTYLLLDPRMTQNLPTRSAKQRPLDSWVTFVNSIFYVGKGKRSRPYSHLRQAAASWKSNFKISNDKKIQHILDIWSNNVGVICLHVFQNVIPAEAYTYEASMIDVIGLENLKNVKCGNYYGITLSWPTTDRHMLGLYLLYKSMQIFFNEGERQLRPEDIE